MHKGVCLVALLERQVSASSKYKYIVFYVIRDVTVRLHITAARVCQPPVVSQRFVLHVQIIADIQCILASLPQLSLPLQLSV